VKYDGRVNGRVVDRNGIPVAGLAVALVLPADVDKRGGSTNRIEAWTAADGTFELRLVPPGEYVLGVNSIRGADGRLTFPRAFYPGVVQPSAAQTIVVPTGERVPVRDFIMPESIKLVTVDGIVVDGAGRPVSHAELALRDATEGPNIIGPRFVTGADGRFVFSVVDGGKYDVHATRYMGADVRTRVTHTGIVRSEHRRIQRSSESS